ncbi:hypothetical protein EIP75_04105 [Aquabacterium soli]|uniref:Uncharacterized protein n=1 Tax=Aquabacterium soli TaxID=2493092 RepID=A0A3R8SAV8_9BURK|nr:hypothetical protein [Aquabacterium soli]RRS05402.1 hypothetical protein EIP75_04105 [Aquabacterium soli]
MNPKDEDRIKSALSGVDNLQDQLGNIAKRGPNAVKAWVTQIAGSTDKDFNKRLKDGVATPLTKLLKDVKSVTKDLETLYKEGSDAKKLSAYADAKAFRTKALAKHLASSKQFELDSLKITMNLMNVIPKAGGMYPGMGDTNVKALVGYMENFSKYYNAFKVELGKL